MNKNLLYLIIILIIFFYKKKINENFTNKYNIWMYWENKNNKQKPSYIDLCLKTIIHNCNSDFKINILNENTINDFLPDLRKDLNDKLSIPQKADYYRYKLLYKYGGIWIDADTIVFSSLKPLSDKLEKYDFIGSGCHGKVCKNTGYPKPSNGVMISRKETNFLKMCVNDCEKLLDNSQKINYFDLGRNIIWKNITILKEKGWDYYHLPSLCFERDSNDIKIINKRLISNESIDINCNKFFFIPIYNTSPGFPNWFTDMTIDEHLISDTLFSKLINKAMEKN